jgi:hypothetical protein
MENIEQDEKGFTCLCGLRNEFPQYVQDHWGVRLAYSCACHRRYILFHGKVAATTPAGNSGISESDGFGD